MNNKFKKMMGRFSTPLLICGVAVCSYMLWIKGQRDAIDSIYDSGFCIVHMTEIERSSYRPSRI